MANDFLTLGIRVDFNDILKNNGISDPTEIQVEAIPKLLKGEDLIAQSQTGTGKTLAFVLPMLQKINVASTYIQGLIITPTRELAIQITKEIEKYAPTANVNILSLYGGQDVERQIKRLKGSPHLVIGTPGRIADHLLRKTLEFSHVSMLVLDEADVMLNMGFMREVEYVIKMTPGRRQTMLFSATIPRGLKTLAAHYMKKPSQIKIQSRHVTLDEIKELVVETSEEGKIETLSSIISQVNPFLAIVFCKTKARASEVNEALISHGFASDELHGDLSQSKRNQVMRRFRDAKLQILVATDIAARGLDIEGVSHIFNYDIPQDVDSYIHRIGRTGRAGQTGVAYTFVTSKDRESLRAIELGINRKIEELITEDSPRKKFQKSRPSAAFKDASKTKMSSFKRGAFEKEQSARRSPSKKSKRPRTTNKRSK
ncbi:MAG: box helicase [Clostridiales bacterium]|jgi:ATP-dependent RNA helicase DeaD|nr:box helicase [Clostridiales bacterium]